MIMASSSRILMSFAREGGLPFSPFFAKVSPTKQLPINALCFSTALQSCLSLVYIGNTALFNSLLVLTIVSRHELSAFLSSRPLTPNLLTGHAQHLLRRSQCPHALPGTTTRPASSSFLPRPTRPPRQCHRPHLQHRHLRLPLLPQLPPRFRVEHELCLGE